jgi:hypothetical protein
MRLPQLGLPGIIGVVLLLAGALFLVLALQPLEKHHATLLEHSRNTANSKAHADRRLIRVSSAEGRLASFYGFFRRDDLITDHLARLYAAAGRAGVEPRVAEYRLVEPRGVRLAEYSISMPVTGSYSQVRTFIEDVLGEIPVLVLDHASVRRKRVADPQVEADIRFTVFIAQ